MRATSIPGLVWTLALVGGVVASPVTADAQVASDPTGVDFLASADHSAKLPDGKAAVSRYELRLFRDGESTPFAEVNLGKPAPASDGTIASEFRARLLAAPPYGVTCVAVVSAVGPEGASDSEVSNTFLFERLPRGTRGDFDGDGDADLALFRYSGGTWAINGRAETTFGRTGDIPVPANYDGEPGDELAVFRPDTGEWLIQNQSAQTLGEVGDIPVPADYDGDGRADIAVFRPSTGHWIVPSIFDGQWGAPGDIPLPGDYDGDGRAEVAVFRPSKGAWYIADRPAFSYGRAGDIPVPADYDGDGSIDAAVFRPSSGTWYVRSQFSKKFGAKYDLPVPQDLNGDGRAELVVWRPATNTWYDLYDRALKVAETMGAPGDLPVLLPAVVARFRPFDFDGDRRGDIGVFRRSTQTWYLGGSRTGFSRRTDWTMGLSTSDLIAPGDYDGDRRMDPAVCNASGCRISYSSLPGSVIDLPSLGSGAVPVPGDYDGDGRTDMGMFRRGDGRWQVLLSSTGFSTSMEKSYGRNYLPVAADYDGDGRTDIAVFRPTDSYWFIAYANGGSLKRQRGRKGDKPVVGDFDGDRRADIGVFRPSTQQWFIWTSSSGWNTAMAAVKYGASTDIPVPADYNGDGLDDIAVFRPSNGYWYLRGITSRRLGARTDIPLQTQ